MKKLFVLLMTAALLVSMFVMPVNAAGDMEVLKGTPIIDGTIDDIYLESFQCGLFNSNILAESWGAGATNTVEEGLCYVLWDDNYMYFAFKVTDSSIHSFTLEEAKADDSHVGQPSAIDGVKMNFVSGSVNIYIIADAYANFVWANDEAADYIDVANLKSASVVDESGEFYTLEIAVPFKNLPDGGNLGWHYCVKNTGRRNDKGGFGSMGGLDGGIYAGHKFELLSDTTSGGVVTDAPTTDATTTDAPTTDAPTTDAPTTDAPTTGAPTTDAPETTPNPGQAEAPSTVDAVVIFAVVALCAAAALVVISKKRTA